MPCAASRSCSEQSPQRSGKFQTVRPRAEKPPSAPWSQPSSSRRPGAQRQGIAGDPHPIPDRSVRPEPGGTWRRTAKGSISNLSIASSVSRSDVRLILRFQRKKQLEKGGESISERTGQRNVRFGSAPAQACSSGRGPARPQRIRRLPADNRDMRRLQRRLLSNPGDASGLAKRGS